MGKSRDDTQSLVGPRKAGVLTGSDATGDAQKLEGVNRIQVSHASGKTATNVLSIRLRKNSSFIEFSGLREGYFYPFDVQFLGASATTVASVFGSKR